MQPQLVPYFSLESGKEMEQQQQEGSIQFDLEHFTGPALPENTLDQLMGWHEIMHKIGLVGHDPHRYGGFAYGNMSVRHAKNQFIISGTQTSGLTKLTPDDYSIVEQCFPTRNKVVSTGPTHPSSECMTHSVIYASHYNVGAIIHVHSPLIWQHYAELELPCTSAIVPYGTPQMATAIRVCVHSPIGLVAMLGHEDGVVAYGVNLEQVGTILLKTLARASCLAKQADCVS